MERFVPSAANASVAAQNHKKCRGKAKADGGFTAAESASDAPGRGARSCGASDGAQRRAAGPRPIDCRPSPSARGRSAAAPRPPVAESIRPGREHRTAVHSSNATGWWSRISLGKCAAWIVRSPQNKKARSIAFRNSRTLPGQSYWSRKSATSAASAFTGSSYEVATSARKCCCQRQDILAPLAQRPNRQSHHVQPKIQILSKRALADHLTARSRCVAAITRTSTGNRFGAADGHHGSLLQTAQNLGLHRERQLADLIEKQRAAVGTPHEPQRGRNGAGERALHVAKELRSHQLGRKGRAIDRHERPCRTAARSVDLPARQFPCRRRSRPRSARSPIAARSLQSGPGVPANFPNRPQRASKRPADFPDSGSVHLPHAALSPALALDSAPLKSAGETLENAGE